MSSPPSPRASFEMKRVIELTKPPEESRERAVLCHTRGSVYCMAKDLYRLGANNEWSRIQLVPFIPREGQTMTGAKGGIAFFGGRTLSVASNSYVYYNDLWLMDAAGGWTYIVTPIAPRAYHAACVTADGNLMIIGGEKGDTVYNDCYIIDLETQTTTRITFQKELQFTRHTVTLLRGEGKYCLLGGIDGSKKANNRELLVLDPQTKEVTVLENDFRMTGLFGHRVAYAFELLFVVGGTINEEKSDYVWMYSFVHHCWIPLKLPEGFNPLFIFYTIVKNKDRQDAILHIIDENLSAQTEIHVYSSDNNGFSRDNPDYIEFLRSNLTYGKTVFSNMGSREAKECQETQELITTEVTNISENLLNYNLVESEDIDLTKDLRSKFTEIEETLLAVKARPKMKRVTQRQDVEPDYKVAETINALISLIKSREQTHRNFVNHAEKQSKKIELLTFRANIKKKPKIQSDIKAFEHSLLLSEQLAGKIQLCQKECEELTATHESEETKLSNCEARICALHRQLFETYNTTCNLRKSIFEKQKSTFETLSKVIADREVDLNLGVGATAASIREHGASILEGRNTTDNLKELVSQKDKLFSDLASQGRRLKGDVTTVKKLLETMRGIRDWSEAALTGCSEILDTPISPLSFKLPPPQKQRKGSRSRSLPRGAEKLAMPVFTPFKESLGMFKSFTNDIEVLLAVIDQVLS